MSTTKPLAYRVHDVVDSLTIGDIYHAVQAGRLLALTSTTTGRTVHLYPYMVSHALCRGAMSVYDETQSPAMHADVVGKLCAVLASHYIY